MIKKVYIVFLSFCLLFSSAVQAQDEAVSEADTLAVDSLVMKYTERLAAFAAAQQAGQVSLMPTPVRSNPYYMRLLSPGTLYSEPLRQTFGVHWSPSLPGKVQALPSLRQGRDVNRRLLEETNSHLMKTYVNAPWLIQTTESQLEEAGSIQTEAVAELPNTLLGAVPEMNIDLTPDIDAERLVVRRPNFWTFKGDYSLQFTQSYFSENWYQGGENNYTLQALATMDANFTNTPTIQWDNRLEMRLGFQTSKSDDVHHIRTNDDLLRFTSKIGYKATKHWFYTLQAQAYTQFYPSFSGNSERVVSDFMSPFNLVVSLGMDYKLELKRFSGSATLSPVAYNFRMVTRPSLYGNFGLETGERMYHYFGPNITVKYSWNIVKNVNWSARIYWFSNLRSTDIEWENTFTFSITKYLNTKLFLYPRIDDSSPSYRSPDKGSYFMFKEWFSLGVGYTF